jgi:aspartate racemase
LSSRQLFVSLLERQTTHQEACRMQIGLIGGIGPAATDFYYRRLILALSGKNTALELTIVHADAPTLPAHLASNDGADRNIQAVDGPPHFRRCRLCRCHLDRRPFSMDGFQKVSPLPIVDMIATVGAAVKERGLKRIGILGTRTVMETRFFGGVTSAEIVAPSGNDLDDVHDAYVTLAASGVIPMRNGRYSPPPVSGC